MKHIYAFHLLTLGKRYEREIYSEVDLFAVIDPSACLHEG